MAKRLLSFSIDVSDMKRALRTAPRAVRLGIKSAIKKTTMKAFRRTRSKTPTDRGIARGGWRFRFTNRGLTGEIFNDVDHINVLEYGGFPVRAASRVKRRSAGSFKRGNAILGGHKPGPRTQRARDVRGLEPPAERAGKRSHNSNVSKQAPSGMIRITFRDIQPEFARELENEINKEFAKL